MMIIQFGKIKNKLSCHCLVFVVLFSFFFFAFSNLLHCKFYHFEVYWESKLNSYYNKYLVISIQ